MKKNIGSILSNFDIFDICNYLKIPLINVCTKDNLPKTNERGFIVVNLDDLGNPGTHWCVISTYDKFVCYFDPFGAVSPVAVDQYIKRVTGQKRYTINKVQIQHINASICGWFCIAFMWYLYYLQGGLLKKLDMFNDHFNSEDLRQNYNKLVYFFKRIMNKK